ncbi:MAG TPA: TPM domain-containing protein [Candidatus Cybelea sp.]
MHAISIRFGMLAAGIGMLVAIAIGRPVAARDFVQDQAGMFSQAAVAQLNARISNFNAQTGKEIVVVTTPSLGGASLQDAARTAFAQHNVNGVLIFVARDDRRDIIVPDRAGAQAGWFTPDVLRSIRISMENQFRGENYDAGITGAVDAILNVYRAHLSTFARTPSGAALPAQRSTQPGGFHISMFWWIIIAIVGFLLLRAILRVFSAPRYIGGAPGAPPGGAPPGTPGYGPGYGYGGFGGGGSFWSGLLGGLGGAWLGNELFRGGGGIGPAQAGQLPSDTGGAWGGTDSGGWQSDAGQSDLGGASSGDWSGGGFGGDAGGDFGAGGGDSGGGW